MTNKRRKPKKLHSIKKYNKFKFNFNLILSKTLLLGINNFHGIDLEYKNGDIL